MLKAFWRKHKQKTVDIDDEVKIIFEKPPIYNNLCAAFKVRPQGVVYTYGNIIYNPDKQDLPAEIIEHEKIHMKQQTKGDMTPDLWWGKYLRDPKFRVDQEAKGYARQYDVICSTHKDRNMRAQYLWSLASSLSGPLYNNIILHSEATILIKKLAKY